MAPNNGYFGFCEQHRHHADNTLEEGLTRGMNAGYTNFSPSGYDWGEGLYIMMACGNPVTVKVGHWIEKDSSSIISKQVYLHHN